MRVNLCIQVFREWFCCWYCFTCLIVPILSFLRCFLKRVNGPTSITSSSLLQVCCLCIVIRNHINKFFPYIKFFCKCIQTFCKWFPSSVESHGSYVWWNRWAGGCKILLWKISSILQVLFPWHPTYSFYVFLLNLNGSVPLARKGKVEENSIIYCLI